MEMDARLTDLKSTQLVAQSQMNSVLESLKAFQPLITKVKEQEKALSLKEQKIEDLKAEKFAREVRSKEYECQAEDLARDLAKARAAYDKMRVAREAVGTEISGLKADLEGSTNSMDTLKAHIDRVQGQLEAKAEEVRAYSAEVQRLQSLLTVATAESHQLLDMQAKERKERKEEQGEMKIVIAKLSGVEESNRQLRQQLEDLGSTHKKLQGEIVIESETLKRLESELQTAVLERDAILATLREASVDQHALNIELEEMRCMCGAMEDQWGEERGKLELELATTSAQLREARRDLQTCTERLETSMAEAKLLTTLKDLVKDEGEKRVTESKLAMQRHQLRSSARFFVADYHRKLAEAAVEVSSEEAHQERTRHAAEKKALRAELEKVKQEIIKNEHQLIQMQMEGLKRWQISEKSNLNGIHNPPQTKPRPEDDLIPGIDDPMASTEAAAPVETKVNGKSSGPGNKPLNGANHTKQNHPLINKSEADAMKRVNKELVAERDTLARKLEQGARDALSERAQLLHALQAAKSDADALRRENKMNTAQVGSLNERAALLEKELVELKKSNSYNTLAPNHAATAMRFRELEERSREAERRLRDAVEENVDLRERIESCEELEMALRAAKEMLKSAETRVREAVEENSDLRKRLYKW
jgi:predicted  nucleic acid-binding Zn-ribbon protein